MRFENWNLDIFSPDGAYVLLLEDEYGPYHIVATNKLKDYLSGGAKPDYVAPKSVAANERSHTHSDGHLVSARSIEFTANCCGSREKQTYTLPVREMNPRGTESHFGGAALRVQTARPSLQWRTIAVFVAVILILGFVSFVNHGVRRVYYGTLAGTATLALVVQYRRERALVSNRLLAVAVVTDWGKPLRSRSRFADALLARFPEMSRS